MASIITATTTSGLTQSADNSGVLQLASGAGNLVTVPSVTGTAMVSGNMPAFSAYTSTNQSVTNSTYTKATLDTEEFDTNSNFASGRFTPTVAGYYQINGSINTGTSSITRAIAYIYKNGAGFKRGNDITVGSAVGVSAVVYLNGSTDYVELWGYVTATTPLFYGTDTWFNGCLIRTA
jgi:hypothetical protein